MQVGRLLYRNVDSDATDESKVTRFKRETFTTHIANEFRK